MKRTIINRMAALVAGLVVSDNTSNPHHQSFARKRPVAATDANKRAKTKAARKQRRKTRKAK